MQSPNMEIAKQNSKLTIETVLATLGAVSGAVSTLLFGLEALENPLYRWIAWGLPAAFFVVAGIECRDPRAKFLQDGSYSKARAKYFVAAAVFLSVLTADVLLLMVRDPVSHTGMNEFQGTTDGYTSSNADNPLFVENVQNVLPTVDYERGGGRISDGASTVCLLQKRKGIEHLLIHDCEIVVDKFIQMPPFGLFGCSAGALDAIKAEFLLEKHDSPLPWTFRPSKIYFNDSSDIEFPILIEDFAPVNLQYYVNASEPGIYWVKCVAVFSDGIGPKKRVVLTDDSIPLAFFNEENRAFTVEEVLSRAEWAPYPAISLEARKTWLNQEIENREIRETQVQEYDTSHPPDPGD
jgi:hypothetical protein